VGRLPFRFPDGPPRGAELALILRAVELSSAGLQTWMESVGFGGIAAAVAWGLFLFKGTLRIRCTVLARATSGYRMLVRFSWRLRVCMSCWSEGAMAHFEARRREMTLIGRMFETSFLLCFIFWRGHL